MSGNGWYVRSGAGGPGVSGAEWRTENVSFADDPSISNNRLMLMQASTAGTGATSTQSQVTFDGSQANGSFLKGTYVTRIKLSNAPIGSSESDKTVQAFYTITPLEFGNDPDYSELDFEYLGNGGWGQNSSALFTTSWETYQVTPEENYDNVSDVSSKNYADRWVTMAIQVDDNEVRYYLSDDNAPNDGEVLLATHSGDEYPETPMSINYNIWFIENGFDSSGAQRSYQQEIDWLYFVEDQQLTIAEAVWQVIQWRNDGEAFIDSTAN